MCTIRVGKMSYGLNKTLEMCTVKIESGLGYKSFQVRVTESKSKSSKNGLKSGLESKSGLEYYTSLQQCNVV